MGWILDGWLEIWGSIPFTTVPRPAIGLARALTIEEEWSRLESDHSLPYSTKVISAWKWVSIHTP
jgi:hypothetical protein